MSRQHVHCSALGYEPMRMKPVHFAGGFFLSICGSRNTLEWLNKTAVTKHKDGLREDYALDELLMTLRDQLHRLEQGFSESQLKILRSQINGLVDNDDSVFAAFAPYSTFGNDYTLISDRLVTAQRRLDGYAGHLVHRVLERSPNGQQILAFATDLIQLRDTPVERLLSPLLDEEADREVWNNPYAELFGDITDERLDGIASLMDAQTAAVSRLCSNLANSSPHHVQLRCLVLALCIWVFLYLQKRATGGPVLLMDFLGNNQRVRSASRSCFARQREIVFGMYTRLWESGQLECSEAEFEDIQKTQFRFLEQHFSDLAVRIGFAQPRAAQVKRKHFELQPDTIRLLLLSVLSTNEVERLVDVCQRLRTTWGICCGACDDDQRALREVGYTGLDQDADLEPNALAFVALLKRLNLATEPSDGLVLCAANPEELL